MVLPVYYITFLKVPMKLHSWWYLFGMPIWFVSKWILAWPCEMYFWLCSSNWFCLWETILSAFGLPFVKVYQRSSCYTICQAIWIDSLWCQALKIVTFCIVLTLLLISGSAKIGRWWVRRNNPSAHFLFAQESCICSSWFYQTFWFWKQAGVSSTGNFQAQSLLGALPQYKWIS